MAYLAMEDFDDEAITGPMFERILETLKSLYFDEKTPKEVRRRILEAAVRAPQDWHEEAVRKAYEAGEKDWRITAIFCMGLLPKFEREILAELKNPDVDLHREAILAAGGRELHAAWAHVSALLGDRAAPKNLRLAAIEASASIQPKKAKPILIKLADSRDEEIAEAAEDALAMTDDFTDSGEWE